MIVNIKMNFSEITNHCFLDSVSQLTSSHLTRNQKIVVLIAFVAAAVFLFLQASKIVNSIQSLVNYIPTPSISNKLESQNQQSMLDDSVIISPIVPDSDPIDKSQDFSLTTADAKELKKVNFDWKGKQPFANKQELSDQALLCPEIRTLHDLVQTAAQVTSISKKMESQNQQSMLDDSVIISPIIPDSDPIDKSQDFSLTTADALESQNQQSMLDDSVIISPIVPDSDSIDKSQDFSSTTADALESQNQQSMLDDSVIISPIVPDSDSIDKSQDFSSTTADVKELKKVDFDWKRKQPFANEQELLDQALLCTEIKALYDQAQTAAQAAGKPAWKVEFMSYKESRFDFNNEILIFDHLSPRSALSPFVYALASAERTIKSRNIQDRAENKELTCEEYAKELAKLNFDIYKCYQTVLHTAARTMGWETPWKPESTYEEDWSDVDFEDYWNRKGKRHVDSKINRHEFQNYSSINNESELFACAFSSSYPPTKEYYDKLQREAKAKNQSEWKVRFDSDCSLNTVVIDRVKHEIRLSDSKDQRQAADLFFAGIMHALEEKNPTEKLRSFCIRCDAHQIIVV